MIADHTVDPAQVRTVLLTSGKLYYELDAYRKAHQITDTAIVRLEQIYPVPRRKLAHILDAYPKVTDFRWVQEEPANMGGWPFMALHLPDLLGRPVRLASLPASSAPAGGSAKGHVAEHAGLVEAALRRDS